MAPESMTLELEVRLCTFTFVCQLQGILAIKIDLISQYENPDPLLPLSPRKGLSITTTHTFCLTHKAIFTYTPSLKRGLLIAFLSARNV